MKIIRIFYLSILVFSTALITKAQDPSPAYKMIQEGALSKNYYFLTLCRRDTAVNSILFSDPLITGFANERRKKVSVLLNDTAAKPANFINLMKISEEEIMATGKLLMTLYNEKKAFKSMIRHRLIPSGAYLLFHDKLHPDSLVYKAWQQDARGINYCIDVYAGGKAPNYPLIDSNSLHISSRGIFPRGYTGFLHSVFNYLYTLSDQDTSFQVIPLTAAQLFLEFNERLQAADYEPMMEGENKAAVLAAAKTKWNAYNYSVIVVPGAGPDEKEVALSAEGMLRCRLAAINYTRKLAPFILVSGGKVHPYKTKYCEAIEMKKFLVEQLKVPAAAILIDPHARHTTTNMRNAVRIMFRAGFPLSKPGLVTTTRGQSNMIFTTLPARCQRELGLVPFKNGKRLTETDTEFFALLAALHMDPEEPIDP